GRVRFGARPPRRPDLHPPPGSRIRLGRNVALCSWSRYTVLGGVHPTILRAMLAGAELVVGDDVGMSGATIRAAQRIEIGARCPLGANVAIVDTDFQGNGASASACRGRALCASHDPNGRNLLDGTGARLGKCGLL